MTWSGMAILGGENWAGQADRPAPPLRRHRARLCLDCTGPLTADGYCTFCERILMEDGGPMLTIVQRATALKLLARLSEHDYPSWPNADSEWRYDETRHGWTSDCRYGCGAWMSGSCSGHGDSDDAFGRCPRAPQLRISTVNAIDGVRRFYIDQEEIVVPSRHRLVFQKETDKIPTAALDDMPREGGRHFYVEPDGRYRMFGKSKMGL